MDVMTNHFLTFDGKSSRDFGVWISGGGAYNAPARDTETISIPGRNGDIIIDNGRFFNTTVSYDCFISRDFVHRIDGFRAYMASKQGYVRLEDTYHPEEFRLAAFRGGLNVSPTTRLLGGRFALSFDCRPQRYLKEGEKAKAYAAGSGVLINPTLYAAKPVIVITTGGSASGTVTINGKSISFTSGAIAATVTLDCETMTSSIPARTLLPDGFPELSPGVNQIVSDYPLSIIPRWYTI